MVSRRIQQFVGLSAWLFLAACGDRATPTSPDANFSSNGNAVTQGSSGPATPAAAPIDTSSTGSSWQTSSSSSGGGGTVKETLVGPAINGVTPSGLATADQSKFSSGGSTILTVQVKNVNLPSGTVLGVTLDFTPVGSITLSGGQGSTTANLGHFAVSRDQVRVNRGNTTILQGGFFQ
jgi:hypothetical protein